MLQIKGFPPKRGNGVKCRVCGGYVSEYNTVEVPKLGRVCYPCAERCESYSKGNNVVKGRLGKMPSFSIEFETSQTARELLILYRYGFFPSEDRSIGGFEWKSPIYRNLRPFRRVCYYVLDELVDYVGRDCGTHIHVACPVKDDIRPDEWPHIFGPLVEYLKKHPGTTRGFWGRWFNDYCLADVCGDSRYEAFSLCSRYDTIEYRLPVFRSAEQYYRVVLFCREVTNRINRFYNVHDDEDITEKALDQLGEGILNLFKKYAEVV